MNSSRPKMLKLISCPSPSRLLDYNGSLRLCLAGTLAFALLSGACSTAGKPQRLSKTEIEIGGRRISVEIARTPEQRATGMKYRKQLGKDEGMLFLFERDENLSFYMKDTLVPLSIAFIRSDGVIANIARMEALTTSAHKSRTPCRYALEMPDGWFAQHEIVEGAKVAIPKAAGL